MALHLRATHTSTDKKGVTCRTGEEWLVKMKDTEAHIQDVYEEVWKGWGGGEEMRGGDILLQHD